MTKTAERYRPFNAPRLITAALEIAAAIKERLIVVTAAGTRLPIKVLADVRGISPARPGGYGLVRIDEMKARINRQYDKAAPEGAAPC